MMSIDSARGAGPLVAVVSVMVSSSCQHAETGPASGKSRAFAFEYSATVTVPPGAEEVRIWVPVPQDDATQEIRNLHIESTLPLRRTREAKYGNALVYLDAKAADGPLPREIPVSLTFDVYRREATRIAAAEVPVNATAILGSNRLAPITAEVRRRAGEATSGAGSTVQAAEGIYRRVLADVDYDKTVAGWGRGDIRRACEVGKGNCSDFHSLFIGMARAREIPAVFEIGFPIPPTDAGTVGGYHCWAWYAEENGDWRPVDVSEADKDPTRADYFFGTLCENRVAFSRGRDLELEPRQSGDPINFFVYPYVEVYGASEEANVSTEFRFRNL